MASFSTHYKAGILGAISSSAFLVYLSILTYWQITICFILCVFGSLLPDIDLSSSKISKFFINIFSLVFSIIFFLHYNDIFKDIPLILFCIIAFFLFKYVIAFFIKKATFHRGIIHSLPMNVLIILSVVIYFTNYFNANFSMALGGSLGLGFFIHLLLDELYSVDLKNARFKKSFGSAIKLVEEKEKFYTLLTYLLISYQILILTAR